MDDRRVGQAWVRGAGRLSPAGFHAPAGYHRAA